MLADGTCKALCKHCKKDLVAGNRAGTSHLNYDLKVCPKNQSSKIRKFGNPSVEIPVFDQLRSHDDFARMVLAHGYSFNMAEHYYTRTFLYTRTLLIWLKVFYDVTKRVSGTKYPTLSLYFNDFCGIYLLLQEWRFSANAFVASMAVPMVEKFEKYWDNANNLLEIATILDPRYKMKSIEYYYGLLYESFVAELRVESARKSFSELFGEYARQPSRISSQASTTRNFEVEVTSVTEPPSSLVATRLGLEKFIYESNSSQHSKSDLEVYLEDLASPGIGNDSFDLLAWWRVNGPKYPILARMARDVLNVPVTTVASESAFSSAKRILDDYRCNLLPKTIEAIMCSHDWLKGRIPVEPRVAVDDVVISDSSIQTRSQEEDQTDDAHP